MGSRPTLPSPYRVAPEVDIHRTAPAADLSLDRAVRTSLAGVFGLCGARTAVDVLQGRLGFEGTLALVLSLTLLGTLASRRRAPAL